MNGPLTNKRPALPPTPFQIFTANYDLRYVTPEPDTKRAKLFMYEKPTFKFIDVETLPELVTDDTTPTNEELDLSNDF